MIHLNDILEAARMLFPDEDPVIGKIEGFIDLYGEEVSEEEFGDVLQEFSDFCKLQLEKEDEKEEPEEFEEPEVTAEAEINEAPPKRKLPAVDQAVADFLESTGENYRVAGSNIVREYVVPDGKEDFLIVVRIDPIFVTFYALFPFLLRREKEDAFYRFCCTGAQKYPFGSFAVKQPSRRVAFEYFLTNRKELTQNEILTYFSAMRGIGRDCYKKLQQFCATDPDWNPDRYGEKKERIAPPNRFEKPSASEASPESFENGKRYSSPGNVRSYLDQDRYEDACRALIVELVGTQNNPDARTLNIDLRNNLSFMMRFGKVDPGRLQAPFSLEIPDLLEEGVQQGHIFSIVNRALYELERGYFDAATEYFLRLNGSKYWHRVRGFWEEEIWEKKSHPEGALIVWLADMAKGRAGNEKMIEAAEKEYEAYVKTPAFKKLRGRLYGIAVRELGRK